MKKVVIMGASSGIGYAVAEALASRGIRVGLAARNTERLHDLQMRYPGCVEYAAIDITKPEAVEKLERLIGRLGGMDIYFHVAGIGYGNMSLQPEIEVEMIDTNAAGFARMICAAYRHYRANAKKGHIAAITSVAGTNGIGRLSAYSATKAFCQKYLVALEQLSNTERNGITFTDIRPGWVKTPLLVPGKSYPLEMDVDYILPWVIKAIVRKKRVAVIDWRWNILTGLWRLVPNLLWTRLPIPAPLPDPK